jgi:hypothetical protein
VKRKFEAFDDNAEDYAMLSESGGPYRKMRRLKSPQTAQTLKRLKTYPYSLLYLEKRLFEPTDSVIFTWRYALQVLGLWPILPASPSPSEVETEFFFNFLPKKEESLGQDIRIAEDADHEDDSDMSDGDLIIAQQEQSPSQHPPMAEHADEEEDSAMSDDYPAPVQQDTLEMPGIIYMSKVGICMEADEAWAA